VQVACGSGWLRWGAGRSFSHRLPGSKDCESFNGKLRDGYLNGEIF
jgi:hypothetical protein